MKKLEEYPNYVPLSNMVKQDNIPEFLVIHCSDSDVDNFESIQRYHVTDPAHLWENIGYHWLLQRDGQVIQGRPELYHGAHVGEDKMNKKSIGICICGRHENKMPNDLQTKALKSLVQDITYRYKIPKEKIKPHRFWAKGKTCPGSMISDKWIQDLVSQTHIPPVNDCDLSKFTLTELLIEVTNRLKELNK